MGEYLADRPDQIVDTGIRCLINLSNTEDFTRSCGMALSESVKKDVDSSIRTKVANALNKMADAIENHGKTVKGNAKVSAKKIRSRKSLPNETVDVKDRKRLKTNASNAKKRIRSAFAKGEDKTSLEKIMDTYHENKKQILATLAISAVLVPAFISGAVEGFNEAIDADARDAVKFANDLASQVRDGTVDPHTASAYGAAYSSVSKDMIDDTTSEFSDAIKAIDKIHSERGKF